MQHNHLFSKKESKNMTAQQAIDEARPMLEDLLPKIGIVPNGDHLIISDCIESFSKWVSEQQLGQKDLAFFSSLIGAFIVVYLTEHKEAKVSIKDNRIYVAIPFQQGVVREFEPYAVAHGIASGYEGDLVSFLENVVS
jgi:hypothetical protein